MEHLRRSWLALLLATASAALAQPGTVLINEIMYDDTSGAELEWVELYNTQPIPRTLSNWVITDGNVFPPPSSEGALLIPFGTLLPANGYLVISRNVIAEFPGAVLANEIDATWALNNGGDNLALYDGNSPTAQLIDGSLTTLYPDLAATNSGNSIEKCSEHDPWNGDPAQWHESTFLFSPTGRYRHCTPGMPNSLCASLCGGIAQAPPLLFAPPTYVGMSNVVMFPLANVGTEPLCIDSLRTNGYIFSTVVPPAQLAPGEVYNVNVVFAPNYEYEFEGQVTIYHSQAEQPKTTVLIRASSCPPAAPPPPPLLHSAGSPNHLYFTMPWDPQSGETTKYAVEYSSNGFATSNWVAPSPAMAPGEPVFVTLGMWGQGGRGVISGLNSSTTYEVRLHSQDCSGAQAVGPAVSMTTEPGYELLTDPNLTIQALSPDSVRLRWNSAITEAHGYTVQGLVWGIYFATDELDGYDLLATTTDSSYDFGELDSLARGFFYVRALGDGVANQPRPIISWPPAGAELAGLNTVVLQDFLHKSLWDSFTVVLDPDTDPLLLGSSRFNPWDLSGKNAVAFDFGSVTPGPHIVRATVIDQSGLNFQTEIPIICRPLFQRDFTANWDQLRYLYLIDTVGVTWQLPYAPAGVLWETSKGQRYGSPTIIEYEPFSAQDSLILIKIKIPTLQRYLSENSDWFDDDTQEYGGVEQEEPVKVPKIQIACCCDGLDIRTAGVSDGTYCGQKNVPLGPIVTCADGSYEVGFAFEVVLTLKYVVADAPVDCYWGQDAKGDRKRELGTCADGQFKPLKPPVSSTRHKEYGGVQYTYDGAPYGNDDYRPDNHGGTLDQSQQIRGKVRWWDAPATSGKLPAGRAVRCTGKDKYFARADPQCDPVVIICCRSWEISWDVTFCEDCSTIQHEAPNFHNEQTPLVCPGLAAN